MLSRLKGILQKEARLCVGVMSGTSLDGIDVAVCRISEGDPAGLALVAFDTLAYTEDEKQRLLTLCSPQSGRVDGLCEGHRWLGRRIGEAVLRTLKRAGISPGEVDFVSSHGQTVYHMPKVGATLQIGDLAQIAAVTGCVTVGDFRPSDMAYGGEGAPLIPYVDWALYRSDRAARLLINIGGIANLTALPRAAGLSDLLAFDTGPGNVLCDSLVKLSTEGRLSYDADGEIARQGKVDGAFLAAIAGEDDFLLRQPPKSTGRERYTVDYARELLDQGAARGLSFADTLATVTDYTAYALADAVQRFVPFDPGEVYVSGGGLHNRFMMQCLAARLGKEIHTLKSLGMEGDAKEAAAFALLGDAFLRGAPNNAPRATGADRPVVMGKLALPS